MDEELKREELALKYFKDDYIPGGTITVTEDKSHICPECKSICNRIERKSPKETWAGLCGRAVSYIVCPKCDVIICKGFRMN